jgi:hypothetical protein
VKRFESCYFELFELHAILLFEKLQVDDKNIHHKGAKDAKEINENPPCLSVLCAFAVRNGTDQPPC